MRPLFVLVLCLFILSCDDDKKIQVNDSSGILNMINIVSDNSIWNSEVGEVIRNNMASDAEGLPQKEPLYKLKHIYESCKMN